MNLTLFVLRVREEAPAPKQHNSFVPRSRRRNILKHEDALGHGKRWTATGDGVFPLTRPKRQRQLPKLLTSARQTIG